MKKFITYVTLFFSFFVFTTNMVVCDITVQLPQGQLFVDQMKSFTKSSDIAYTDNQEILFKDQDSIEKICTLILTSGNIVADSELQNPKKSPYAKILKGARKNNPELMFVGLILTHNLNMHNKDLFLRETAISLLLSIRDKSLHEDLNTFMNYKDSELVDQRIVRAFEQLSDDLKNQIRREYQILFNQGSFDGKALVVADGQLMTTIQDLIGRSIIPTIPAYRDGKIDVSLDEVVSQFVDVLNGRNGWFSKVKGLLVSDRWQNNSWISLLPLQVSEKVKKLYWIKVGTPLNDHEVLENLTVQDLQELALAKRVPFFIGSTDQNSLTFKQIAFQWVKNYTGHTYGGLRKWSIREGRTDQMASWLKVLPKSLQLEVKKYFRCAVLKKGQQARWLDNDPVEVPVSYLVEFGVIPFPDELTQDSSQMSDDALVEVYADFIVKLEKKFSDKKIAKIMGMFTPDFQRRVVEKYALLTSRDGRLLKSGALFENIAWGVSLNALLQDASLRSTLAHQLKETKTLNLSSMHIHTLTKDDLKALENLDQVETFIFTNNEVEQIPQGFLDALTNVKVIDLSKNKLVTLPARLLAHTKDLVSFDASSNSITNLPADLFNNLESLKKIKLSQNSLDDKGLPLFGGLNLEQLYLDENKLSGTSLIAFSYAPQASGKKVAENLAQNLQELYMNDNQINVGTDLQTALHKFKKLRLLNLARNKITAVRHLFLAELTQLEELILSGNPLATLSDDGQVKQIPACPSLKMLKLDGCKFTELANDLFKNCPHLKQLFLENNSIKTPQAALTRLKDLEVLNMANNALTTIEPTFFKEMKKLQVLNLSKNKIATIKKQAFQDLESLEQLNLSNNHQQVSSDDETPKTKLVFEDGALRGLHTLKQLDLSYNNIDIVAQNLLNGLDALKELSLAGNNIKILPSEFFSGRRFLETVDLSHNEMTSIPEMPWEGITRGKQLNFRGNDVTGVFSGRLLSTLRLAQVQRPWWLLGKGMKLDIEWYNQPLLAPLSELLKALRDLYNNEDVRKVTSIILTCAYLGFVPLWVASSVPASVASLLPTLISAHLVPWTTLLCTALLVKGYCKVPRLSSVLSLPRNVIQKLLKK